MMRELKGWEDPKEAFEWYKVAAEIPMMRELKGIGLLCKQSSFSVAAEIPMMRELKVSFFRHGAYNIELCCSGNPYDEGTESLIF